MQKPDPQHLHATQPRRGRGRPPRFTRTQVLRTALRLIEELPPDAFSLRRVADELELTPMGLYSYVTDLNDLFEGAALLALDDLHDEPDPDMTWDQRIRMAVLELYRFCRRYPNLVNAVPGQRPRAAGLFRTRERILEQLVASGLPDEQALPALGVLTYYALGFAAGQTWSELPLPDLSPEEFPQLTRLANRYPEHASEEAFLGGLDRLLHTLRTTASLSGSI